MHLLLRIFTEFHFSTCIKFQNIENMAKILIGDLKIIFSFQFNFLYLSFIVSILLKINFA